MRIAPLLVCLALASSGCAHLDYMGETSVPTGEVQIFYSEANVPHAYRVMGELVATSGLFVSNRKIQEQMVKKAREKGADAVVLLGMEQYQAGSVSSYSSSATESKDKKGRVHLTSSGSSSTSSEEKKKLHALLIKYKPPGESAAGSGAPADTAR